MTALLLVLHLCSVRLWIFGFREDVGGEEALSKATNTLASVIEALKAMPPVRVEELLDPTQDSAALV